MKSSRLFMFAGLFLAFIACNPEIEHRVNDRFGRELTFEASFGDKASTKTTVQSDGSSVWWSAHESINIFYGNSESSLFTSTNDEPVARAQFRGTIPAFTAETENGTTSSFWGIYPYNATNTCDGHSVIATLPSCQVAKAESFADKNWLTIAKSEGLSLAFYAVGAGFRFSVTKEGVTSVTFRGNNNEVLAGKAKITMDGNHRPVIQEYVSPERVVTMTAPMGESLETGKLYYISFFPNNFENGFTITFNTATESGIRVYETPVNFQRTDVHRGRNFDANITYQARVASIADAYFRSYCLNNFDKDHDGEISLSEAQDVTSIDVCTDNITSLEGIAFFENLEHLYCKGSEISTKSSGNTFAGQIESLNISQNHELTELDCTGNRIETLDLSSNLNLEEIICLGNPIETINISEGQVIPTVVMPEETQILYEWTTPVQPFDEIWYTSTDGNIVTPNKTDVFGANIVSNTYNNGKGILKFDGVVSMIGQNAFFNCRTLSSISLPSIIRSIGNEAFTYCTSIKSIHIPDYVEDVGRRCFSYCSSLSSFTGKFASSDNRYLYEDAKLIAFAPAGIQSYTIGNNIEVIGDSAFEGCSSLSGITLPERLIMIESQAFYACTGITSITLPETLEVIGIFAFGDCGSLQQVIIPSSVTEIRLSAFDGCSGLARIVVKGKTPVSGGKDMFSNTNDCPIFVPILSVDTYQSTQYWIDYADRIQKQPNNEIWYTSTDGNIVAPNVTNNFGTTLISNTYYNGMGVLLFDGDVTMIGDENTYSSDNASFYSCNKLKSISLPSSVLKIGNYAFFGCNGLIDVSLPDHLYYLGASVFAYSSVPSIYIPTVDNVNEYNPLAYLSKLEEIRGPYATEDGRCLIIDNVLKSFASAGLDTYVIQDPVTEIGAEAFVESLIDNLHLPCTLLRIKDHAFSYCPNLTGLTLPDQLEEIGYSAFVGCTSFTSFCIPENCTVALSNVFSGCTSLASFSGRYASLDGRTLISEDGQILLGFAPAGLADYIFPEGLTELLPLGELPSSLTSLSFPSSTSHLFLTGDNHLSTITCLSSTPPSLSKSGQLYLPFVSTIFVPSESVTIYKAAPIWSNYADCITAIQEPGIAPDAFPDAHFRSYVFTVIDTDKDLLISTEEAAAVTEIEVCTDNISSLVGIEHFPNLQTLSCYGEYYPANAQTKGGSGSLASLDISQNLALTSLDCHSNKLTTLDISNNTNLTVLDCSYNRLTSLSINEAAVLAYIDCCDNCLENIETGTLNLSSLRCSKNSLSSIDLSGSSSLTQLRCDNNQLTYLILDDKGELTDLHCHNNLISNLAISNCSKLSTLYCYNNQLQELNLVGNQRLSWLDCHNNLLSTLTADNHILLRRLHCSNNPIESISCNGCSALEVIECENGSLTSLSLDSNTELTELNLTNNQLNALNVSANTKLTDLIIPNNLLSTLDVSQNTLLSLLNCTSNPNLTEIWLKAGQTIQGLHYDTQIATIYRKE